MGYSLLSVHWSHCKGPICLKNTLRFEIIDIQFNSTAIGTYFECPCCIYKRVAVVYKRCSRVYNDQYKMGKNSEAFLYLDIHSQLETFHFVLSVKQQSGPRFRCESIRAVIRAIQLLRESKLIRVSDTMIKNT